MRAAIIYTLYCSGIAAYLFLFANSSIPSEWQGTNVDLETFLTPNERLLSEQYLQLNIFYVDSLWMVRLFFKKFSKKQFSFSKICYIITTGYKLFVL